MHRSVHGVTQGSFDTPCVALPGGFNSALISANTSSPILSWNLVINDTTDRQTFLNNHFVDCKSDTESQRYGISARPPGLHRIVMQEWLGTSRFRLTPLGAYEQLSFRVINPPNISLYNTYLSAARVVTGTPSVRCSLTSK